MASSLNNRLSREDFKKQKELEELRKTGAAPPELDEDGKMINPHIPQYISQAPWYLNSNRPGLKHQKTIQYGDQTPVASIDKYYQRGAKAVKTKKMWVKGACENCGATTHKTKQCCERPRARGAKLTKSDIADDEVLLPNLKFDFEGKRDRWNGYDPSTYKRVIDHYERVEAERRKAKQEELDEQYKSGKAGKEGKKKKKKEKKKDKEKKKEEGAGSDSAGSDHDSDTDTDSEASDDEMKDDGAVIQKHDARTRTTVRNLRIREDTAKYLRNLAVGSAHYDPKTRSMRENPYPNKDPKEVSYAGDNWVRKSGDTQAVQNLQSFVWEAQEKGNEEVVLEANPSAAQLMYEEFKKKKEALKDQRKTSVLEKYGGEEHMEKPPQELLQQTEAYVEYSEDGKVIKGLEKAVAKSKYIEDALENEHKEVWGSYYDINQNKWGYKCCHQTIRHAYCTGEAGKKASDELQREFQARLAKAEAPSQRLSAVPRTVERPTGGMLATKQQVAQEPELMQSDEDDKGSGDKDKSNRKRKKDQSSSESGSGSGSGSDSDKKARKRKKKQRLEDGVKARREMRKQLEAQQQMQARPDALGNVSEHQMDKYMKSKVHADDPMAKFLGKDDPESVD